MSFSIPYIFKNGVRKKRDYAANQQCHQKQPPSSMSSSSSSSGVSSGEGKEPLYPTLVSMIQSKTANSPNPSPTSSTSSRSRPTSIAAYPSVLPEPEELEDNRFYRYIRSHFNLIFSRSSVVCIPHSKSLEGLVLTKDFIETHSYNPSPYYRGQYQAANGKVISIELPIISTISGFKESRTVHVMSEEWVYLSRKKVQIFMIERPLEGEPPPLQPRSTNTISIPTARCSKTDLDFLSMFPENAEALHELQLSVQKFVDTYVYIRGFNAYTVEKIQHMYMKTWKIILQRNKLLRDACRVQSEHDHFLELVENVVMGFLHEKIWIQSLRSILQSQDNYLDTICRVYAKESITLNRYAVSHPIADMPLECFESAITCMRKVDTDAQQPISATADEERSSGVFPNTSAQLAFTPLEKLNCVRKTLDLISSAVSDYIQSTAVDAVNDSSIVNTDEMIPLFAYILVHSNISRIASLAFYMEYFRLSLIERSEHNFALVTLKAAVDFLKGDPLSLHDASSGISTISTNSTSSAALSPKIQSYRTRSTSCGSPIPSPAIVSAPSSQHYRSVSMSSQTPELVPTSPRLRHRKSHSADLRGVTVEVQGTTQQANNRHDGHQRQRDKPGHYDLSSNIRRNSLTPSVVVRPPIVLSNFRESNRKSLDIPNEWMIARGKHSPFSPPTPTSHSTFNSRPSSFATPKISHTRPIVSTTFPTISNSSPLPGHSHDTNDNSNNNSNTSHASSASSSPVLISDQGDKSPETRRLARSLSSTSTMLDKRLRHPPEVINLRDRDGIRRPASICIDPRSMRYQNDDDDGASDDLMGDFLRGLQTLDGDIVGEASGSYRTVRRL